MDEGFEDFLFWISATGSDRLAPIISSVPKSKYGPAKSGGFGM